MTDQHCPLTRTEVLCYVAGRQGGTLTQLARDLNVTTDDILTADATKMHELCRVAHRVRFEPREVLPFPGSHEKRELSRRDGLGLTGKATT